MDSRKKLQKYIQAKTWTLVLAWVFLALTIASLVMYFVSQTDAEGGLRRFDPYFSDPDSQVYLDITGVSDWVYRDGGAVYYSAEDAQGQFYTLRLSSSQYSDMGSQQEYWIRESDDVLQPEPYRIAGCVRDITYDIRSNMAEAWEISQDDYDTFFGSKYLDATTRVGNGNAGMWMLGAILCLILTLAAGYDVIHAKIRARKNLDLLEMRGLLDEAAAQLDSPENLSVARDTLRLSQKYLYGRGTGEVIPYSDILWVFQHIQRYYFIAVQKSLVVCTCRKKRISFNLGTFYKKEQLIPVLERILQANPDALLGYSMDNAKAFRERWKTSQDR